MFGKKKKTEVAPVDTTPAPQVADELAEQGEELEVSENQEEVETPEAELSNAQIRVVLENIAADIAKIKYHLRLDF